MPTYVYRCTASDCAAEWEQEQRITEAPQRSCPECGQETARRQICCTAFVLSGPRWARDGYAGAR